ARTIPAAGRFTETRVQRELFDYSNAAQTVSNTNLTLQQCYKLLGQPPRLSNERSEPFWRSDSR
ncbi:MAG: hypothetical protein WCA20_33785, partial [Candidatus Sulfotelmatobacter sp.]